MAWDVQFRDGVWLPQTGWWLDAHHPVERSFVSHAHFDHLAPHREILCSEGTARLMRARMPAERREHVLAFGRTEMLTPDTTVTLHPAGHIFGSSQSLFDHETRGSLLYTGDFKLSPGRASEPCATPRADTLIMETTFGRPQYVFPPKEDVLATIVLFCRQAFDDGDTPMLFGYSLGKSQELLSCLTGAKLPVMLHPQTLKLTRIYEELGLAFPLYREFVADELTGHVVICPPQTGGSIFLKKIPRRRTAMITGWALDPGARFRYQCDAAFPLSDHADFSDLLRFVELVRPRRVFTLHGFAADFARTLRERGVEAWAIGQDNQLEMPLTFVDMAPPLTTQSPASPDAVLPVGPDTLDRFAAVAEQIKTTAGKLEKTKLLGDYLSALSAKDAACGALFFTGKPFPQSHGYALNLGWSMIKRALLEITGLNEGDYRRAYLRFSDSGDTAEAILAGHTQTTRITLADIAQWLDQLAKTHGSLRKLDLLKIRLRLLSPAAAKYFIKIITGDLRIGLKEGLVEEAVATSSGRTLESVREAHMLCGDIAEVTQAARADALGAITLRVFHPIQFMLASPEPTAEAILARLGPPVWLEEKYDGIRCQLHKKAARIELFSRDLNTITAQFPDLAAAANVLPGDCVLDGELLAWRGGRALPFAELQKRLGRKGDDFFVGTAVPVSFSAYDLLWRDGRALLKAPLHERRAELIGLFSTLDAHAHAHLMLAPAQQASTAPDIEAAFLKARARGNEGLMAKDPHSPYTPGRRGQAWLKLKKAYATLDVVVVAAEYGHGKRKDVLSDYTFSVRDDNSGTLLTVGKAYSGLTDVEIATLTRHFLGHTLEEKGRRRSVVPDVILEIAFDTIQPSKRHASGYALRFPRIVRIREDKTVADIDTLATCRRLAMQAHELAHPPPI